MGADASIYSLIKPAIQQAGPLDQYAQTLQLKNLMGQNSIHDLQLRQAQAAADDDAAVRRFYGGLNGADPRSKIGELLAISPKAGRDAQKFYQDADKSAAELGKTKADTRRIDQDAIGKSLSIHREQLVNVNDPQAAAQWVIAGYNDPMLSPVMQRAGSPEEVINRIPKDPEGFANWKRQNGLGIEKFIEKSMPNIQTRNTGGTTDTLAINPFTGVGAVTGSVKNTQSPDSAASVGATIRGQNMTDARSRDANKTAQGNQAVNTEGKLRDDFNKQSQEFVKVRDAHQRVIASAQEPSAAGDLSLIFNYMKVLDPGSTVREGEFATAQNSGGIDDRSRAMYNKVISGERLSENMRKDFVNRSEKLYTAAETNQAKTEEDYKGIATRSGANPENVIVKQRIKTPEPKNTQFNSLPDPAQYNGKSMRSDDGVVYKSNGKNWMRQ